MPVMVGPPAVPPQEGAGSESRQLGGKEPWQRRASLGWVKYLRFFRKGQLALPGNGAVKELSEQTSELQRTIKLGKP